MDNVIGLGVLKALEQICSNLPVAGTSGTGAAGKSAYDLWLEAGNVGSLSTFLTSLKGVKGDAGDPGKSVPGAFFAALPSGGDDTAALQASINAAANSTLFVGPGTYKVSLGTQHALLVSNPVRIVFDRNATLKLSTTASFAPGWGVGYSTVVGMLTIRSSNVTIEGGTFDWNTTNATLTGYCATIYVTTGNPSLGGPYYTDVRIDGCKVRNSRGAGIWAEDTSRLWIVNTNHSGGNATDILVLRSLVNLTDVHVDNNHIDCSTVPTVGQYVGNPIQLAINLTGSPGLTTDRWSMNHNTCEAGLNTNVYFTMTQIYAPFNADGANGVWRRGEVIGNILSGAVGGGGPMGGAEAISAVNVVNTVISNNTVRNCYIGIELVGFYCTCANNSIVDDGTYMQVGIFMDGGNQGHTIVGNTISGMGAWTGTGISGRTTRCTYIGNTISSPAGAGCTGISLYVDSQNATLGDDSNAIVGNVISLGGQSVAFDCYDMSNLVIANNVISIESPTYSAIYLRAPGTVAHAPRDYIAVRGNMIRGGKDLVVDKIASADWGQNIFIQTGRVG